MTSGGMVMMAKWVRGAAVAAASAILMVAAPAPPAAAQGQPGPSVDMTGLWIGFRDPASPYQNSRPPSPPPFTAEGAKMSKYWEDPANNLGQRCLPGGGPLGVTSASTYFPMEIIQKPKQVTLINEYQQMIRRAYTDGRSFPEELEKSWFGYSIGRWDGDTLVIETKGVREGTLNGSGATVNILETDRDPRLPFSNALQLTERIRMIDGGKFLESEITVNDPVIYTQPFTMKRYWRRADDLEMFEYICAENLRPEDEGAPPTKE